MNKSQQIVAQADLLAATDAAASDLQPNYRQHSLALERAWFAYKDTPTVSDKSAASFAAGWNAALAAMETAPPAPGLPYAVQVALEKRFNAIEAELHRHEQRLNGLQAQHAKEV